MNTTKRFIDPNIERKDKLLDNNLKTQSDKGNPPSFSVIEFNLCGLCNRRCVFCPKANPDKFPNIDEHMPVALYEKVMADLRKIKFNGTILYSAFSEPLLCKNLNKFIELSRKYCPEARIEVVTNGDPLTLEILVGLFKSGLTALSISMYDGPHQLKHFKELQKKANLTDDQLIFRVRWLSRKEHFGITLSNRSGSVELKDIGIAPLGEPMKRACYYPFYQILVDYDGSVLLCAHDWARKLIVGDVNNDSILEIWNNKVLERVRLSLSGDKRNFPPCDVCDAEGVLMGKKHFERWNEYYESKKRS